MKLIRIGLLFLGISLVFTPSAYAWTWSSHSSIVDMIYHGLPSDVQQKLDLGVMRDASNDPDEKFKDFKDHSYPNSYVKAQSWLGQGKDAYNRGDYRNASYCFGVASHYISDTFSAPHCISKEASSNHTKYEDQAEKLTPTVTYSSGDLKANMENGYKQGMTSWKDWLQTKDNSIVHNNLNMGASVAFSAIKDSINTQGSTAQQTTTPDVATNNNTTTPNSPANGSQPINPLIPISLAAIAFLGVLGYKFILK